MSNSVGPVLEVDQVGVTYGGVVALSDVSVRLEIGRVLGVIGPNGAGKTTLFDVVSGIRGPDSGLVRLDGREVSRRGPVWRARHGMRRTFQRQQIFSGLSVEDNVRAGFERVGRGHTRQLDETIELCGLGPVRDRDAGTLPIALARMVELGRAIVSKPSVLLLDEPTSGLGEVEVERLGSVVAQIREEGRCGVMLVEHDIGFVMAHCNDIVVLEFGQVIASGPPEVVAAHDEVRRAYLG